MRTDEEGRKRQPIDASSSRRGDETKAISSKEFFLFIIYSTVRGCSSRRRLLSSLTIDNSSAVAGLAWQVWLGSSSVEMLTNSKIVTRYL